MTGSRKGLSNILENFNPKDLYFGFKHILNELDLRQLLECKNREEDY